MAKTASRTTKVVILKRKDGSFATMELAGGRLVRLTPKQNYTQAETDAYNIADETGAEVDWRTE